MGDGSADRGLLIYQPAAMFYWVFLAVALAGTVLDSERAWRLARVQFAVAAVALGLAYLGYRLCVWLVGTDAPLAGRGAFHDVVGRAEWFAHFGLYGSLNFFDLTWSPWLAVSSPRWRPEASCSGSFAARGSRCSSSRSL